MRIQKDETTVFFMPRLNTMPPQGPNDTHGHPADALSALIVRTFEGDQLFHWPIGH